MSALQTYLKKMLKEMPLDEVAQQLATTRADVDGVMKGTIALAPADAIKWATTFNGSAADILAAQTTDQLAALGDTTAEKAAAKKPAAAPSTTSGSKPVKTPAYAEKPSETSRVIRL